MEEAEDILNEVIGSDVIGAVGDFNLVCLDPMSILFDEEDDEQRYEEAKKERKKRAPQKTVSFCVLLDFTM